MNEGAEQRIVTLYTSGQSIESITKAVGRARHLVVHVLQSKGVFGNRPTEPADQEGGNELFAVEEMKEEPVPEEWKSETLAVKESESDAFVEKSPGKKKRIRKSKAPENLKPLIIGKAMPKPAAIEKHTVSGRWAPQVVDALFKLVAQRNVNTGMSLEEVKRMVSKP